MPEKKRFLLRLDPRLYEILERWAADEFRSVNAQIELILWEAARRAGRAGRPAASERRRATQPESPPAPPFPDDTGTSPPDAGTSPPDAGTSG